MACVMVVVVCVMVASGVSIMGCQVFNSIVEPDIIAMYFMLIVGVVILHESPISSFSSIVITCSSHYI